VSNELGLLSDVHMVLVPRYVVEHVERAVRSYGQIVYMDGRVTKAGFQNVIVWGTPDGDGYIVLIAGES